MAEGPNQSTAQEIIDAIAHMRGEHLVKPIPHDWASKLWDGDSDMIRGYQVLAWESLNEGRLDKLIDFFKSGSSDIHPLLAETLVEMLEGKHPHFRIELIGQSTAPTQTITPSANAARRERNQQVRLRMLDLGYMCRGHQARVFFQVSQEFEGMKQTQQKKIWKEGEQEAENFYRFQQRYNEAKGLYPALPDGSWPKEFFTHKRVVPEDWEPKTPWCKEDHLADWIRQPAYVGQ